MTRKDQHRMRRLEIENEELRGQIEKHLQVYREQSLELIELRTQLRIVRETVSAASEG